jgi:hypothetical protein
MCRYVIGTYAQHAGINNCPTTEVIQILKKNQKTEIAGRTVAVLRQLFMPLSLYAITKMKIET